MGIADYFNIIRDNIPEEMWTVPLSKLTGKRVACDTQLYLYTYIRSAGPKYWVNSFTMMCSIFRKHGISVLFVFDGADVPIEKKEEQVSRRVNNAKLVAKMNRVIELRDIIINTQTLDSEVISEIKSIAVKNEFTDSTRWDSITEVLRTAQAYINKIEKQTIPITQEFREIAFQLITSLGMNYYVAPGEGEGYCAQLVKWGIVDASMSEDSDLLAYGCPEVWTKLNLQQETVEILYFNRIVEKLGLTPTSHTDMCIMLGCDYNSRVRNFGPKKILPAIQIFETIENVIEEFEFAHEYIEGLKYKRCRELFSLSSKPLAHIEYPTISTVNVDAVKAILRAHGSNLRFDEDILPYFSPKVTILIK